MEDLKRVSEKAYRFLNRKENQFMCLNWVHLSYSLHLKIDTSFPDKVFDDQTDVDNFLANEIVIDR